VQLIQTGTAACRPCKAPSTHAPGQAPPYPYHYEAASEHTGADPQKTDDPIAGRIADLNAPGRQFSLAQRALRRGEPWQLQGTLLNDPTLAGQPSSSFEYQVSPAGRCSLIQAVSLGLRPGDYFGWKAIKPMPIRLTVTPATSQAEGRTPSIAHNQARATAM